MTASSVSPPQNDRPEGPVEEKQTKQKKKKLAFLDSEVNLKSIQTED